MGFSSAYVSKVPDETGYIAYSPSEDAVWRTLIGDQDRILANRAVPEVLRGLELLDLPRNRVPQVQEVDARLQELTRFGVQAVPAMISEEEFFRLLADRRFPVATFVRRPEEIDYLQEPDIFHEVYGHCPLLTDARYCDAIERFGRAALELGPDAYAAVHRLFWFTVEFGLAQTREGVRIFGAGITSSAKESVYCLESKDIEHRPFDPVEIVGTDYRIDVLQGRYYVMNGLDHLYRLADELVARVPGWIEAARRPPRAAAVGTEALSTA